MQTKSTERSIIARFVGFCRVVASFLAASRCFIMLLAILPALAIAEEPPPDRSNVDKSAYDLFNPTPPQYLREMAIDGPGATDSPYTVDAGHFQIELSFANYVTFKDAFEGVTYRLEFWAFAPFNLKVGLFDRLELQLLLEPYDRVFEREDGYYRSTRQGFGDTTLRFKFNLWGNDRGATACALIPYVKFPTSVDGVGSDVAEGGLAFPFAAKLPWEFHLGLETRFARVQNILGGTDRHAEFANSILLAHRLIGDLEGYVEFFSSVSTEHEVGWAGTFDSGLVFWLTEDLQINAGANMGLTRWADDWSLFAGMAWRY